MARNVPISVRLGLSRTSQGTAWFVTDRHVVTALHVVGSVELDAWAHEFDPQRTYELGDGTKLTPVARSSATDLALLRADAPQLAQDITPLATDAVRGGGWYTIGFPGFYSGQFALTGKIVNLIEPATARSVQLLVDQGTRVDWGGISGAPVIAAGGAVGVITNATDDVATAWAAPVQAVRALLANASVTPPDLAPRDVPRDLAELRLAAQAALATESDEVASVRTLLEHELELCKIHESRIPFFAKRLASPLAEMTPYFQEQFDHHRNELVAATHRLGALLVRLAPR